MAHETWNMFISFPQMASNSSIHIFVGKKINEKKKSVHRNQGSEQYEKILIIMNNKTIGNGLNVPKRKYISKLQTKMNLRFVVEC